MNENIVPCVVFAFNRPDKLKLVLAALRTQDIDSLIVFVDGPRDDADVELVERCKAIAKGVDWVEKELYFREQNQGLSALSDNISEVMSAYKSAVFVEDDVLPMPAFYSFIRRALSHYESEKKVFSIGGHQPIQQKYFKNYPYSLVSSARFHCWGWGTWQDRWELITPYLSRYWELFDHLTNVPEVAGSDVGAMARACAEGRQQSWAVKVSISTLWLEQVHLLPTKGLVRNIGIGDGVHGGPILEKHDRRTNRNVYEHPIENIVWLDNVELNRDYVEKLKQFVEGTFWQKVYKKLPRKVPSVRRIPHLIKNKLPGRSVAEKPNPKEYSTIVGKGSIVPCQIEAYFLALNEYVDEGANVLDVEFGLGYGLNILAIKAKAVSGVDSDPKVYAYCQDTVVGRNPRLVYLSLCDGYNLEFPDNHFDVVTGVDMLEHVEDYHRLLKEMLRVSQKGVFISTPNRRPEYTNHDGTPKNYWHLREWSFEELDEILKQHGKVDWNFLNGPVEGPFTLTKQVVENTLTLSPFVHKPR